MEWILLFSLLLNLHILVDNPSPPSRPLRSSLTSDEIYTPPALPWRFAKYHTTPHHPTRHITSHCPLRFFFFAFRFSAHNKCARHTQPDPVSCFSRLSLPISRSRNSSFAQIWSRKNRLDSLLSSLSALCSLSRLKKDVM